MRRLAFGAVVFSSSAMLTAVLLIPMAYNYVMHLQSQVMIDTEYCQVRHCAFRRGVVYFVV